MKERVYILLLILVMALPAGMAPRADAASFQDTTPQIHQTESPETSSSVIFRLFATPQHAETRSETTGTFHDGFVEKDFQEDNLQSTARKRSAKQHTARQLSFSHTLKHRLTAIRQLIFPSHYFL